MTSSLVRARIPDKKERDKGQAAQVAHTLVTTRLALGQANGGSSLALVRDSARSSLLSAAQA